ncbi:MFS transporter [Paenibacillus luteus]|uniref:MFS transporter n=1 Tax=Paenibacillus luteus TaxID=2545753 RepID=UPI0011439BFA|nr:MFS transporter [Paenibacillus luteus]
MNHHIASKDQRDAIMPAADRFPWAGLLTLAMAVFIGVLTETIPAGLLPQISAGLGISEALAGQLITLYALGSLLAAIPLTAATRGWGRRRLLLLCIIGFLVFNSVTALSSSYVLTLAARFLAGVAAGVLWGMAAGFARRIVPDALKGRAMAVAMVGTPLALALGVPAGTALGGMIGWRAVLGIMSLLTVVLIPLVFLKLPNLPGQPAGSRVPLAQVFVMPGVRPVLAVVLGWVLAHNILYTYIAPYAAKLGLSQRVDVVLLIFGITSVIGIWITGMWIDRMKRQLVLISIGGFVLSSIMLGLGSTHAVVIYAAVGLWGITFGGAATLLQTAVAEAAGENADVAQSMLVTVWNLAIGGGGLIGAVLLETLGVSSFPWALALLLLLAWIIAWRAKAYGFPRSNR